MISLEYLDKKVKEKNEAKEGVLNVMEENNQVYYVSIKIGVHKGVEMDASSTL